jgi:GTP-binding protein
VPTAEELLRVTLVGRPNVGKSTLFNRFVGRHDAITAPEAGTTRDRIERMVTVGRGIACKLIDVGGLTTGTGDTLDDDIQGQVHYAIERTDVVVFVIDAKTELTSDDFAAADLLRKSKKPVLFIANKWESADESELMPFVELGLGLPHGISALHLNGFDALKNLIATELRKIRKERKDRTLVAPEIDISATITIIGRPNVGKSSLLNALAGEKRAIVSAVPCTTRDSNDIYLKVKGKNYRLIDTAGLRRPGKIGRGMDRYATGRTLNSISEADVALLLIDGADRITAQDLHIAQKAFEAGASVILVVNKIDAWKREFADGQDRWLNALSRRFQFARWLPVVMISAEQGTNLEHLFPQIEVLMQARRVQIPTTELNLFFKRTMATHPPGHAGKAAVKVLHAAQVESSPPTIVCFTNRPEAFHFSYKRYLENALREEYGEGFPGTPIRIEFKDQSERIKEP